MRRAFITGITGQTGSYLAELLLAKGYEVHGLLRRSSSFNTGRIDSFFDRLALHYGDVTDAGRMRELVQTIQPAEVYHLAAQSHVRVSFDGPAYTVDSIVGGTLNMLEAVRGTGARFYNAASSEMFGSSEPPQNESTPFKPRSPYACAKVYGFHQTVNYREAYGLFAVSGILFNHESERRGETFVTRKITRAATRIKLGLQSELALGNIWASRDWGFAGDYVEAMWLMLQQPEPDDFVVATGEMHTVSAFLHAAFSSLGLDWQKYVRFDERLKRPAEVDALGGDASKARRVLGWSPRVEFSELVSRMVTADLVLANQEQILRDVA